MTVNTLTLYMPGSSVGIQVYEGSQLHLILVSQGASFTPSAPVATPRADPFPQYVDNDELAAVLAGFGGGGGGGGGAVDSVNGQAGVVVLDADDIDDSATRKLMTSDERDKLAGISPGANVYTDEQARDVIGATLAGGSGVTVTADDAANTITISAASGGSGTPIGGVALDSFAGASDDAKLTAALAYAAAQTVKPPILFDNRQYTFSQANRQVFSGMKLAGPFGHGNQQRSANSIPNDIRYTGSGTWWQLAAGSVFDVGIYGLSFQGNSNAQFMASGSSVLWTSVFRDLGFNLWKHVLGNPTTTFLMTANLFDGWWNVNNGYNTAFTIGGSDNNLWMDGMLLDSEPATMADGAYHLRFDFMEKTSVGPLFVTCDQNSGIFIDGSDSRGPLVFFGQGRVEGRNKDTPCLGSNIRINGGHAAFRDWWVSYGATNLAGSGHTGEGGVVTMTGGRVLFDGCMYSRATGVAETVPWIYQTGGKLRIRDTWTCDFGGTWTGLPRVRGLGGTRTVDDSVTVVTV